MPFSYDANIDDLNDAILAAVNSAVASASAPLNTRLDAVQTDITDQKTRVTTLEGSTPTDPDPEPEPEPTPTPTVAISSGAPVWTTNGVTFNGKVSGVALGTNVYLRVDTAPLTGQRGFYEYEPTTTADGAVNIVLADYISAQAKLYWSLAVNASELAYGDVFASGSVTQPATPTPDPTPTPTGDMTGGSGGALTDRTNQTFTNSAGITSKYHIYASGLNWSKKVGILIYGDGSAEYGLKNPGQNYLMAGTNGLIAIAKKHNMVLLTPMAPGNGCTDGDGVCWYEPSYDGTTTTQKTRWSFDLIQSVYGQYNIDKSRVAIGGYSSGAQWTSQFILPSFGTQIMTDGVFVPISFGGAPITTPTFTAAFKGAVVGSWDCGTNDEYGAYGTQNWAARGGYNWYSSNGFTTDYRWVSGGTHDRSGEFGSIMDREITQHVKSA